MIARTWHGWTTAANADAYQRLMCDTVIPEFAAREIAGLMQIDLLRGEPDGDEVEFTTLMLFDTMAAVERFAGDDPTRAVVPAETHALLTRFDPHSVHRQVVDRRIIPDNARGRTA